MTNSAVEEEILTILREEGGVVRDPNGFAARFFYDRCASARNKQIVSGSLTRLDRDGLIIRDMPSAKRCTLIALPDAINRAPRKSLRVVLSETVENLVGSMEEQIQAVIDTEIQACLEERGESDAQVEQMRQEIDQLKSELHSMTDDRDRYKNMVIDMQKESVRQKVIELRQYSEELKDELRIAKHNAEHWERKARNKKWTAEDLYETIEKKLRPEQRAQIAKLMAEGLGVDVNA